MSKYGRTSRRRGRCACIAVSLLTLAMPGGASPKKKAKYGERVVFAFDSPRLDDTCVLLSGSMTAGQFFRGLQRRDTANGPQFRKGSAIVENFPEQILINIEAVGVSCSPLPGGVPIPPPGSVSDFLKSLRLEAQWERGSELRPVEGLSVEKAAAPLKELMNEWNFDLTIRSKDVPLSDHLVILIFSKDNKKLAQLVASL